MSAEDPSLSVINRYNTWTRLFMEFAPTGVMIDRYTSLIWFSLGFFGNILSLVVWITPKVRQQNSSAIYLAALSATDFFLLLFMIVRDLEYAWDTMVLKQDFLCRLYQVIYMTVQYLSPTLVLAFTVERWIAVCYPFMRDRFCTPQRACVVVSCLACLSLGLCIIQGYFWSYEDERCAVPDSLLAGKVWIYYTWVIEFVMSAAVPVLTLVFNLLVIQELYKISNNQQPSIQGNGRGQDDGGSDNFRSTTIMLLSVSFYLIFTTLPAGLVYALQSFSANGEYKMTDAEIRADPVWQSYFTMMIIKAAIDELALSHFACNFIIYLATGKMYRSQVAKLFGCTRLSRRSDRDRRRHEMIGCSNSNKMDTKQSTMSGRQGSNCKEYSPLALKSPEDANGNGYPMIAKCSSGAGYHDRFDHIIAADADVTLLQSSKTYV